MKKFYLLILLFLVFGIGAYSQYNPLHMRKIKIYNQHNVGIANYAALVVFSTKTEITAGRMQSDGRDIRFAASKCFPVLYDYYIESGINTDTTYIWVKIPTINALDSVEILMFY